MSPATPEHRPSGEPGAVNGATAASAAAAEVLRETRDRRSSALRLSDRALWVLIALGALALAIAVVFAVVVNSTRPLQPVPLVSSARA